MHRCGMTGKATRQRSNGSWDIPSGAPLPLRTAIASATCMEGARRSRTTSTGMTGFVADFAGFDNSKLDAVWSCRRQETLDAAGSVYTFMVGCRACLSENSKGSRLTLKCSPGVVHASSVTISGCTGDPSCTPIGSDTTFAAMAGVGFRHQSSAIGSRCGCRWKRIFCSLISATRSRPRASRADGRTTRDLSTGIVLSASAGPVTTERAARESAARQIRKWCMPAPAIGLKCVPTQANACELSVRIICGQQLKAAWMGAGRTFAGALVDRHPGTATRFRAASWKTGATARQTAR